MGESITSVLTLQLQEKISKVNENFERFRDNKTLMDRKLLTRVIALEDKTKDLLTKYTEERVSKDMLEDRLHEFIHKKVADLEKRMEDQIIQVKMQMRDAMFEFTSFITDFQQMKSALRSQLRDTINFRDRMLEISDRLSVLQKEGSSERIKLEESLIQCREQVQCQWELLKYRNAEYEEFKGQIEIIKDQFIENSKEFESAKRNHTVPEGGCGQANTNMGDDTDERFKKMERKFKLEMERLSSSLQDKFEEMIKESLEKNKQDLLLNSGNDSQKRIEREIERIKEELFAQATEIQKSRDEIYGMEEYFLQVNEQHANVENEVEKLKFVLESLDNQLVELNDKFVDLQLVVLRGKNFWDEMCMKHNGQLSGKELYGVIADVGKKFELMKVLVIKRIYNLEMLREKLAAFERSIQSRAELEKKVLYLTASVENVQSLIYSCKDSFSTVLAKDCLANFENNWPLDAILDSDIENRGKESRTLISPSNRANVDRTSGGECVEESPNLDLSPSSLEWDFQ